MTASIGAEPLAQKPHWLRRAAYPLVTFMLGLAQVALFFALQTHHYALAGVLVLLLGHLMHGAIIGLHEASHGLLRKNRFLNELDGIIVGIFSLTSFSLFRAAHQTHHIHLGTEKDVELWPFVLPQKSRRFRVLVAFIELFAGLVYTPALFLRTFLSKDSPIRSRKVRRRIWWELALLTMVWSGILGVVASLGAWKYLLCMYVLPAWIAGNLHSWRKYIEHVGLTGTTVNGITRSIVADDFWGRLVAFSLLHEPFHGVHHHRMGLPHSQLPDYVSDLHPVTAEEQAPFRSYGHALHHLIGCLSDPRVGPQWRVHPETPRC